MNYGLYWIAINGSSCAIFGMPLRWPIKVSPIPEVLIGFQTLEESQHAQQLVLNEPIEKVKEAMRKWILGNLSTGRPMVVRPENPEPSTEGQTLWMEQ